MKTTAAQIELTIGAVLLALGIAAMLGWLALTGAMLLFAGAFDAMMTRR